MTKSIFIKNKRRAIRSATNALRTEIFVPEHERLHMSPIMATDVSEDFMNEKRKRSPVPLGSRKPPVLRSKAVNPAQQDQAWLPPSRPQQVIVQEKDYSQGDVEYDDVPDPPQTPFEHTHRALGIDLSGVLPGQYCLIYAGEIWSSDSIEDVEEAIEHIMRSDPNVQDEDLMVIKRLNIKVGVSIDD